MPIQCWQKISRLQEWTIIGRASIKHKLKRDNDNLCSDKFYKKIFLLLFLVINIELHYYMHAHTLCILFLLPKKSKKATFFQCLWNKSTQKNTKRLKRKDMTHVFWFVFCPFKAVLGTADVKCHVNNISNNNNVMMMSLLLLSRWWWWLSKVG